MPTVGSEQSQWKEQSMYETAITVRGNVVDEPERRITESGVSLVGFRIASTQRRFDSKANEWVDGHQLFLRVTCWREMAENVVISVSKGDPVVVTGRLHSKKYVKDEVSRMSYEIDADTVGHDLSRGISKFEKRSRRISGSVPLDADGLPERPDEGSYEMLDADGLPGEAARSGHPALAAAG
jgi:single-strand DNA-binding protein